MTEGFGEDRANFDKMSEGFGENRTLLPTCQKTRQGQDLRYPRENTGAFCEGTRARVTDVLAPHRSLAPKLR